MQNFTLGKKGITMLLFGLVLLIGSVPSYGQTCPTVGNTSPDDFCYLSRVSDLTDATGTTISSGAIAWYRTATSVNAIPNNELLKDGSYFAGNQSGNCTARTEVSITVDDIGPPDPLFGNIFSPCVFGPEPVAGDPDPIYIKTVQDLIDNIDGTDVQIFAEEFDVAAIAETTALVRGENYFAGQRSSVDCSTSSRIAIRYDPIYTPAPNAGAQQIVCEGATVADLQATATTPLSQGFRWYSTIDSQPALADSTPLIEGEDYYVSQIVNRIGREEPPCESTDRVKVTVEFDDIDAGEPNSETYCKSEFDVQLNVVSTTPGRTRFEELFLQLLDPGVPTDGTFDPFPADLGTAPQTYTTTYTVTSTLGCEDSVELTIIVTEDPTAGNDNLDEEACRNDFPAAVNSAQVEGFFRGLVDGGEPGGTFPAGDMAAIAADFNSNNTYPVTYSSTYTIGEGTACEDSADLAITINESPDAGSDNSVTYCDAEIQDEFDNSKTFENLFEELLEFGVSTDGTFDSTVDNYSGPGTYTSIYTITSAEGCTDSAIITIEVNNPSAGDDNLGNEVCRNELPATVTTAQVQGFFADLLSDNATAGGSFSNINDITAAFNTNETYPATYNSRYTVSGGTDCEDFADLSVIIYEAPNAGPDITDSICITELETLAADFNQADPDATIFALLDRFGWDGDMTGTFDPSSNDLGAAFIAYYNNPNRPSSLLLSASYTVISGNTVCANDVSQFAITINDIQDASAGDIPNQEECSNNGIIDLNDYLVGSGATPGGTFSGEGVLANSMFDTSIGFKEDGYLITYSVDDSADCTTDGTTASDDFTLTVNNSLDSTAPITRTLCFADIDPDITEAAVVNYFNSLVAGLAAGTFSPTPEDIFVDYKTDPIQKFVTTYTVGDETCGGSVQISVTVNPVVDAEAGVIADQEECSNAGIIDLTKYLTDPNTTPGGTFSGEGVLADGMFDTSIGSNDDGYDITYTVNGTTSCVTAGSSASEEFTLTINDSPNAGADLTPSFCTAEIDNFIANPTEALSVFDDFITDQGTEVSTDGTFNRTLSDLLAYYTTGDFTNPFLATYTVSNTNCTDVAEISITITPMEQAEVSIDDFDVCSSEDSLNLFTYLNLSGGTFTYDTVEIENGLIDISTLGKLPEITYTVNEDVDTTDCIEGTASTTFNVEVDAPVNAGSDRSRTLCRNQVNAIVSEGTARNYYLGLLDAGVPRNGTFNPTIQSLVDRYNIDGLGTYTSEYTVQNGSCTDSAEISVVVTANTVINAGDIADQPVCSSGVPILLAEFLTESGATLGGTFSGIGVNAEGTMFDPSVGSNANGYIITYKINTDTNACVTGEATSTFTITVNDPVTANAGDITDQTVCSSDDSIVLSGFLTGSGATLGGTFSGDGVNAEGTMFDPSSVGSNDDGYTITYTVNEDDEDACVTGEATSTFIITVNNPLPANAGDIADQTVCSSDDAIMLSGFLTGSGATLGGTFSGNGVNADGTIFDPSVGSNADGYTITYTVNEDNPDACVTGEATSTFIITVSDPADAPTASASQSFCLVNNNTVADLVASGDNIVWYEDEDITIVALATTPLENGDVYYAVATGDNTCGSPSTMVTVTMNDPDAPTLQMDGNEFCRSDNPTLQDLLNNLNGSGIQIYASLTGGTAIASTTALQDGVQYFATATDATLGCESSERIAIRVEVKFCGIPEGFSPNGDGKNDTFEIPDIAIDFPNYNIEIYNRWGNMVFKGNASTPDWDGVSNQSGTIGDGVLPVGVYFYILNYNDGATASEQGKLYLSR